MIIKKVTITNRNYGGDGHTIAENTGISKTEGHFVYDSYLSSFPNLRNYWDLGFRKVVHFGYIQYNNITKRKFFYDDQNYFFKYKDKIKDRLFRYEYPDASSIIRKHDKDKEEIKRYSMNYPIQGTAGDMTKYAGILLFKEILKRGWLHIVKIVNFVHDEILVECPKALAKEVEVILVDSMRKAGEPFCKILPINADANISEHWVH